MKVVLLAGGLGTRLSEYTNLVPKPMVEIGEHPILWHIMNLYAHYGHKDFYVALGYKGDVIKNFFSRSLLVSVDAIKATGVVQTLEVPLDVLEPHVQAPA